MENDSSQILDYETTNQPIKSRKDLLPKWIKVFCWIFMISGAAAMLIIPISLFSGIGNIGLYGFRAENASSLLGIALTLIYLLKGITGYGLWTGQDWAITIAQVDAILGILICLIAMIVLPIAYSQFSFEFRLEIFLLIPYLQKMNQIKKDWIALS